MLNSGQVLFLLRINLMHTFMQIFIAPDSILWIKSKRIDGIVTDFSDSNIREIVQKRTTDNNEQRIHFQHSKRNKWFSLIYSKRCIKTALLYHGNHISF